MMAASTVAAPPSSLTRLGRRDGLSDDDDSGQNRRPAADPGDDVASVPPQFDRGSRGGEVSRRRGPVAPGRQPGRLTRGVDALHLEGDGDDAGQAEYEHRDQAGDGQGGLHRGESAIAYTRVVSARLMMLVSAPTIESPVTTL